MKRVIVDTSVWSLALRKKDRNEQEQKIVNQVSRIISNLDLVIIGPIRQEILSGISDNKKFEELREKLAMFENFDISRYDYEYAAECFNKCRKNGIQGSHIDFLICSVATNNGMSILTLDNDFAKYKKYIKIKLEKIA
jgi:predicted nucleic acid-binding protein